MKKRVDEAKKIAKERGEKIEKDYFYPKRMFRNIVREYDKMKLEMQVHRMALHAHCLPF